MRPLIQHSFFIVALSLLLIGCEKYPDHIPDWVESKIKYCARRNNECYGLTISEYGYRGLVYYELQQQIGGVVDPRVLHDFGGTIVCPDLLNGNDSCGTIVKAELTHIRSIWAE